MKIFKGIVAFAIVGLVAISCKPATEEKAEEATVETTETVEAVEETVEAVEATEVATDSVQVEATEAPAN